MSENSEGEVTIGCTVFIDDWIEEMQDIGEVVDGDELVWMMIMIIMIIMMIDDDGDRW